MMCGLKNVSKIMSKKTKIQQIKLFIKASIIIAVLSVFVVLGIFVRPAHTFENARMKKWLSLDEQQRKETIERIIKDAKDQELLIQCVTKIADLPNSNEMLIRDAVAICYNGIQMNVQKDEE